MLVILVSAFFSRGDRDQVTLLLFSSGLFVAAGLITRQLNFPINEVVMTWSAQAPPADWIVLRDAWWRWHILRFSAGAAGLLIWAALRQRV